MSFGVSGGFRDTEVYIGYEDSSQGSFHKATETRRAERLTLPSRGTQRVGFGRINRSSLCGKGILIRSITRCKEIEAGKSIKVKESCK